MVVPRNVRFASGPFVVSSQVIQVPHGVGPPAQFAFVPLRLTQSAVTLRSFVTSRVVVPPPERGSYALSTGPNAGNWNRYSWLRTIRVRPLTEKAAMPSPRAGVGTPS